MKRGRELIVGRINEDIVNDLLAKGITLETPDVLIDDAVIVKYIKHVKNLKNATVSPERYWMVEKTLHNPTHVYEDTRQKYLVYLNTRAYSRGRVLKVIVHPNYKAKGRTFNYLKSVGVVDSTKMDAPQYRKLK